MDSCNTSTGQDFVGTWEYSWPNGAQKFPLWDLERTEEGFGDFFLGFALGYQIYLMLCNDIGMVICCFWIRFSEMQYHRLKLIFQKDENLWQNFGALLEVLVFGVWLLIDVLDIVMIQYF